MNIELAGYVLRDLHPWEGASLFTLTGNPIVMRYMGFKTHTSVDQATALIERYAMSPSQRWLAVCDKDDTSDVLGVLGFEVQGHTATVTIMFRNDWKARGAGRKVSTPFVQWIFTHPQIWRVWAYVHVDNIPAQRVLERMGAMREGCLNRFEYFPNISGEPQNVYVYAIVRCHNNSPVLNVSCLSGYHP